jgi:radical SAM protein with 4Fe4S-binding SPASM domain
MNTRRDHTRVNLVEMSPLDTPRFALIEVTNYCNLGCVFCPTGDAALLKSVGRPSGFMSLDFAKQVIDQFGEFPQKIPSFHFQHMGEPLMNINLPHIIKYAVDRNVADWYEIRTNGLLLRPELNRRLIASGVSRIGISVNGLNDQDYLDNCKRVVSFDKYVKNIADLYNHRGDCEIYIKIIDIGLTDDEKFKFESVFGPISTDHQIEYLTDWGRDEGHDFSLGREGLTHKGYAPMPKKVCPFPFFTLGVTWHGETVGCCFDWSYATSSGNAKTERLVDIWNGQRLRDFRKLQLDFRKDENPACNGCNSFYMCVDNLDGDADVIKSHLG